MRQYLIVSRIHLILSVVNFALAAPLITRGRYEVRVDVGEVAKDGTAASQTLSRFGPRGDAWSGSNEKDWKNASPGPEPSDDGSSGQPGPSDLWSESESNFNSPIRPSGSTSPSESPSWPPSTWYDAPKEPPPMPPDFSRTGYLHPSVHSSEYPSNTHSYATGSENSHSTNPDYSHLTSSDYSYWTDSDFSHSTGSDYSHATGSDYSHSSSSGASHDSFPSIDASGSPSSTEHSPPQSPGQTDNHPPPSPPPNPAPSTGPQQPTDGLPPASPEQQSPAESESETFLTKLWKGKITAPVL